MYYVCDLKVEETDSNKEGKIDYLRTEYFLQLIVKVMKLG